MKFSVTVFVLSLSSLVSAQVPTKERTVPPPEKLADIDPSAEAKTPDAEEQAPEAQAAAAAVPSAAEQPAADESAGAAAGLKPKPKPSEWRDKCEAEMRRDPAWFATFRNRVRPDVHKEDANRMLNNYKHVIAAYVAIWALTTLFILFVWMRQQRLNREISRLEDQLAQALAREGGA